MSTWRDREWDEDPEGLAAEIALEMRTTASDLVGYEGSFQPKPLLHLAELCEACYLTHQRLVRRVGWEIGYDFVGFASRRGAQSTLFANNHHIVLAIRGSSELVDWVHDLLAVARVSWSALDEGRFPKARVGLGFRTQANRLLWQVYKPLRGAFKRYPAAKLVITGHSLGGALTELVAAAIEHAEDPRLFDMPAPSLGVAFSAPRAGNQEFVKAAATCPFWHIGNSSRGPGGVPMPDKIMRVPWYRTGARHRYEERGPTQGDVAILTDDGPKFGLAQWGAYRAAHKTSFLQGARILSRLRAGFGAHPLAGICDRLDELTNQDFGGAR